MENRTTIRIALFSYMLLFLPAILLGQGPGCPNVNAGPDTTLPCAPSCVDLNATMLETGNTTSYTVNSIPYSPPFPFTGGTSIFIGQDDIWSSVINLPFTFCFYGNTYSQIIVGANGLLSFNTGMATTFCEWNFTASIPSPGPPGPLPSGIYNNSINGAYHDIDPSVVGTGAACDINYAVLGTAPCRTFVVNYYEIPHFENFFGPPCNNLETTQQIVLYETTNAIEVYISNKPTCNSWNNGNAVIGLQNANGTQGITPPGRNTGPWTASNEAWRFVPSGPQNFTVEWFDGPSMIGTSNPINVCPSVATDYVVQVTYTNCNGSTIVETDTVNVAPTICGCSATIPSTTNVTCVGACDGTATVSVNTGVPPYIYSWLPSGGTGAVGTGLCANTVYTVAVIDGNSDTCISTVSVGSPLPVNAIIGSTSDPSCAIAPDGIATVTVTGGTGNYTYSWSPSGGNGAVATGLSGGVLYTVTVWDANGCLGSDTVTLNEPNCFCTPSINLTTAPSCVGICDGSATVTMTSGTPPFTYNWSHSGGMGTTATGLCGDTLYSLTVIDGNSDTCVTSVQLVSPPPLMVNMASYSDPSCMGVSDGIASVAATGGTGAYTYSWFPSGGNGAVATGLSGGVLYTVTVWDANGCVNSDAITLVNPASVVANIASFTNPLCDTSTGNATVSASGGTLPYFYSWSPAGGTNATGTGLLGGITYTVMVVDSNGCTDLDSIVLVAPASLVVSLVYLSDPSCDTTSDGNIIVSANGGTGNYTYTWMPPVSTGPSAIGLPGDTTYAVVVTDSAGCLDSILVALNFPPPLNASITGIDDICLGDTVSLLLAGSGGTPGYSYLWLPSGLQDTSMVAIPASTTTYDAVVIDTNGCLDSSSFEVRVQPLPAVAFDADPNSGCVPLTVVFYNLSDSAVSCTWDIGDGILDSCGSFSHTYSTAGSYDVQLSITDTNGCVGSFINTDYINVFESPTADFEADPWSATINTPTIQFTDQSTFSASWNWDFAGLDSSIEQSPFYVFPTSDTGSYPVHLWVSSSNGCFDSITKWVYIKGDFMLFVPNSFSPNGDGINDEFFPKGMGFKRKDMQFSIFNRWGAEIYTSDKGEPWSGMRKNGEGSIKQDVYVWVIRVVDETKKIHRAVGHVTVVP